MLNSEYLVLKLNDSRANPKLQDQFINFQKYARMFESADKSTKKVIMPLMEINFVIQQQKGLQCPLFLLHDDTFLTTIFFSQRYLVLSTVPTNGAPAGRPLVPKQDMYTIGFNFLLFITLWGSPTACYSV